MSRQNGRKSTFNYKEIKYVMNKIQKKISNLKQRLSCIKLSSRKTLDAIIDVMAEQAIEAEKQAKNTKLIAKILMEVIKDRDSTH